MPEYTDAQLDAVADSVGLVTESAETTRNFIKQVLDRARELAPATGPEERADAIMDEVERLDDAIRAKFRETYGEEWAKANRDAAHCAAWAAYNALAPATGPAPGEGPDVPGDLIDWAHRVANMWAQSKNTRSAMEQGHYHGLVWALDRLAGVASEHLPPEGSGVPAGETAHLLYAAAHSATTSSSPVGDTPTAESWERRVPAGREEWRRAAKAELDRRQAVGDTPDPPEPAAPSDLQVAEDSGAAPQCYSMGPRIIGAGTPRCVLSDGHDGDHVADDSWASERQSRPPSWRNFRTGAYPVPVPARTAEEPLERVIHDALFYYNAKRNRHVFRWADDALYLEEDPNLPNMVGEVVRRVEEHFASVRAGTHQPEHPDLIDDEGSLWEWAEGYHCGGRMLHAREDIESTWGPVREVAATQAEPPMLAPDPGWPAEPATVEVHAEEDERDA